MRAGPAPLTLASLGRLENPSQSVHDARIPVLLRMPATTRLDQQVTGNAGLYYCCYKLSLLGWNVMPTARNARGVDIVAYNAGATAFLGIQVKALSKRNPVPLGTSLDKCLGDFWVIVNQVTSSPTAFVMRPEEVKRLAHRGEKDGRVSFWLQPKAYDTVEYREAWSRIGFGANNESSI